MNIGGYEIRPGWQPRFICEVSNNHNGSLANALELIDAAKAIGCDYVKFQAFTVWELIALRGNGRAPEPWGAQGWTMQTLYQKAETPAKWFPALFDYARERDIVPFASVFGEESLAMLESLDCPIYKLASLDYGKTELREMVLATGKPLIESCPLPVAPKGKDSLKLYCPPGYPQEKINLGNIKNGYDGFSYHGTDPNVLKLALASGARLIEAHMMLDDLAKKSHLESKVSLTASQYRTVIDSARKIEIVA